MTHTSSMFGTLSVSTVNQPLIQVTHNDTHIDTCGLVNNWSYGTVDVSLCYAVCTDIS